MGAESAPLPPPVSNRVKTGIHFQSWCFDFWKCYHNSPLEIIVVMHGWRGLLIRVSWKSKKFWKLILPAKTGCNTQRYDSFIKTNYFKRFWELFIVFNMTTQITRTKQKENNWRKKKVVSYLQVSLHMMKTISFFQFPNILHIYRRRYWHCSSALIKQILKMPLII